jgi:hypothetical protein
VLSLLCQGREILGVAASDGFPVATGHQYLLRELAYWFEQAVARDIVLTLRNHHRPVDEAGQCVHDVRAWQFFVGANCLGRAQIESACKYRGSPEQVLFVWRQQTHAPLQCCAQRLLTPGCAAAATYQQRKSVF